MTRDVYVFGDSHWRVFFPFVNHGSPGLEFELDGIRMIDMVANELSGATMYGLLNDNSKNGARRRILGDLDRVGPVENVGLVFGEVDLRYHNHQYFHGGRLDGVAVLKTILRYKQFIDYDLLRSGRVTGDVFVYFGFSYPQYESTLLQPGIPIGDRVWDAMNLHDEFARLMPEMLEDTAENRVHVMLNMGPNRDSAVSADGVHFDPPSVFPFVHSMVKAGLP